jgi:hypothetical protein
MDSLNIAYTQSQLKLMEQWDLVKKGNDNNYHTSINILDSISTHNLRNFSKDISSKLSILIESETLKLKSYLKSIGRQNNLYSVLFSYVIDGLVWDYLENEDLVEKRDISLKSPLWDGEYWTLYPKRDFYCGTNSISEKGFSIKVNWSEKAIPKMIPFVNRFDLQGKILNDFIEEGKVTDREVIDVFGKFNFFDSNGNFTAPVIEEKEGNAIYNISKEIASKITNFMQSEINLDNLKNEYNFNSNSQALVIVYHEMVWDIMNALENKNIVEKPVAFKEPSKIKPSDIGNLIVLVKK